MATPLTSSATAERNRTFLSAPNNRHEISGCIKRKLKGNEMNMHETSARKSGHMQPDIQQTHTEPLTSRSHSDNVYNNQEV